MCKLVNKRPNNTLCLWGSLLTVCVARIVHKFNHLTMLARMRNWMKTNRDPVVFIPESPLGSANTPTGSHRTPRCRHVVG